MSSAAVAADIDANFKVYRVICSTRRSCPYVSIVFVKNSFIPRCLFHSLQLLTPVYESFLVCVFFFLFLPHLRLSFVVFTTEEISFQCWAVSHCWLRRRQIFHNVVQQQV